MSINTVHCTFSWTYESFFFRGFVFFSWREGRFFVAWRTGNKKTSWNGLITPHVVFLPVIFLSFFFGRSKAHKSQWNVPINFFLTSWPWSLTYLLQTLPLYPSTWLPCQNSSPYVCSFGSWSRNRQTHTYTDTPCQNYHTSHLTDMVGISKSGFKSIFSHFSQNRDLIIF